MPDLKSQVVAQLLRLQEEELQIVSEDFVAKAKPSDDRDVMGKWQRLMRPYNGAGSTAQQA